jgi:transcriptional regulator with XRE-family HTH domain
MSNDVHARIRRAMAVSGLRQADLARELGISPAAVSYWFAKDPEKRTLPSDENLQSIASVTGVTYAWLRDGEGLAPIEVPAEGREPTKVRRRRVDKLRDQLLELLTKSGVKRKRAAVDVSVNVWSPLEQLQDTFGAAAGESVPSGDYRLFFCDERTALDVMVVPPTVRSREMHDARAALFKLSVLRGTDRARHNLRDRYLLALIAGQENAKVEWSTTPSVRVLGTEARVMGIEARYVDGAGELFAELFPSHREGSRP